jgi:hypothetical protein
MKQSSGANLCIVVVFSTAVTLVSFLIKLNFSLQIFEKISNIIFHANPSCGSQVVPCGLTQRPWRSLQYSQSCKCT